ncbi:MAG: hypothetical protein BGO67_10960 [Alphaproteobacteria bacterium 41-28]|nr:MAG: hypothetical protein BGO67_10960 [Alphaproteobacteria bacterium 41-28]
MKTFLTTTAALAFVLTFANPQSAEANYGRTGFRHASWGGHYGWRGHGYWGNPAAYSGYSACGGCAQRCCCCGTDFWGNRVWY